MPNLKGGNTNIYRYICRHKTSHDYTSLYVGTFDQVILCIPWEKYTSLPLRSVAMHKCNLLVVSVKSYTYLRSSLLSSDYLCFQPLQSTHSHDSLINTMHCSTKNYTAIRHNINIHVCMFEVICTYTTISMHDDASAYQAHMYT